MPTYETDKAQFGVARARELQRERESAAAAPAPAAPAPAAPAPAGPAPAPAGGGRQTPRNLPGAPGGGGAPAAPAAPAAPGGFSGLDFAAFSNHPDNVGKAPGRLRSEYEAYKVRNTAGYGGRRMQDVGGEQLYRGGEDATGMRAHAAQAGMSEDFQRFDEATLRSWEQYRQPNPPDPRKPYLVEGEWVEKPIDSAAFGRGTGVHGRGGGRGGGGGRGRGAGGAGGGAAAGGVGAGSTGLEGQIEGVLSGLLSGENTRYTPEVMQGILAKIKQQMEGSKRRQQADARSEAAGRGMSRAGATGARLDEIGRGAESAFTGEYADLLQDKVNADYEDQMGGLDRAMKYVDSLKLELYRKDMTALQRQQLRAQIKLAEMNISAQRENLNATFGHQRDMAGAQFGYDAARASF